MIHLVSKMAARTVAAAPRTVNLCFFLFILCHFLLLFVYQIIKNIQDTHQMLLDMTYEHQISISNKNHRKYNIPTEITSSPFHSLFHPALYIEIGRAGGNNQRSRGTNAHLSTLCSDACLEQF